MKVDMESILNDFKMPLQFVQEDVAVLKPWLVLGV